MTFQSYSQVGQDKFAWEQCGERTNGTFLDIGCGHPTSYNNSYGLERLGWKGMCVDIHEEPDFKAVRPAPALIIGDALDLHWPILLGTVFSSRVIDYLSIDLDDNSFEVLWRLPLDQYRFRVITIEHDKYRIGPAQQHNQRTYLADFNYTLAQGDVLWEGKPFEDWWTKTID